MRDSCRGEQCACGPCICALSCVWRVAAAGGTKVVGSGTGKGKRVTAAAQREGLVPIKAPLLGTVYRRPTPDAPPYVEMGSFVKEDDTVCLIEVMKVFSAVKAGVRGRITEVLVETNEMVEYGQPLFMVKPEAEPA